MTVDNFVDQTKNDQTDDRSRIVTRCKTKDAATTLYKLENSVSNELQSEVVKLPYVKYLFND